MVASLSHRISSHHSHAIEKSSTDTLRSKSPSNSRFSQSNDLESSDSTTAMYSLSNQSMSSANNQNRKNYLEFYLQGESSSDFSGNKLRNKTDSNEDANLGRARKQAVCKKDTMGYDIQEQSNTSALNLDSDEEEKDFNVSFPVSDINTPGTAPQDNINKIRKSLNDLELDVFSSAAKNRQRKKNGTVIVGADSSKNEVKKAGVEVTQTLTITSEVIDDAETPKSGKKREHQMIDEFNRCMKERHIDKSLSEGAKKVPSKSLMKNIPGSYRRSESEKYSNAKGNVRQQLKKTEFKISRSVLQNGRNVKAKFNTRERNPDGRVANNAKSCSPEKQTCDREERNVKNSNLSPTKISDSNSDVRFKNKETKEILPLNKSPPSRVITTHLPGDKTPLHHRRYLDNEQRTKSPPKSRNLLLVRHNSK